MDMAQPRWETPQPDWLHLGEEALPIRVNIHRTRSFPGTDIGSDHDLVMMTFRVRLKKARKPNQPRLRFDLEKLRDPDVACTFQATIGGKFAPLIGLSDEDMDIDTMITTSWTPQEKAMGHQRCSRPLWWEEWFEEEAVWSRRSERIQGGKHENLEGSEESKGGLDRCSVQGDWNLPEQKQQRESISAGKGSNLRETG